MVMKAHVQFIEILLQYILSVQIGIFIFGNSFLLFKLLEKT